ncbi:AzlD domain-containing protein [Streptomyces sp. NPDC048483]|uniref:branched-chain amino acid transporter permease n=1 Tax=Streptomyces sp. NPDC048483 TaxID=3154927 RepID=UPI00341AE19A
MRSDTAFIAGAVLTVAVITFALRAVPFVCVARLRSSAVTKYLARLMPPGFMVILVVYLLRDVPLNNSPYGIPQAVALLVTTALHLWRRNAVLSIVAGTSTYILLINFLSGAPA